MKKLLISILFTLSLSSNSYADSGVRESIEEMFELTDMQAMLDGAYAQMDQVYAQMASKKNIPENQKDIYEKHRQKFKAMLMEQMSWDKIKEPIIEAYA